MPRRVSSDAPAPMAITGASLAIGKQSRTLTHCLYSRDLTSLLVCLPSSMVSNKLVLFLLRSHITFHRVEADPWPFGNE